MASRSELFSALGMIEIVDPIVEAAYENSIQQQDSWYTTAFHASAFPADDPKACARQALYKLMNVPGESFQPRGMAIMRAGADVEKQIGEHLARAGRLLHPVQTQVKITIPEVWLTGKIDYVLEIGGAPLPVEVKTKDSIKLKEMLAGSRFFDLAHRRQLVAYIGTLAAGFGKKLWPELRTTAGGVLYYAARDAPRTTKEYYFGPETEAYTLGLERLKEWRGLWIAGRLPERDKSWRWTEEPCKWCSVKKICKQDVKDKVEAIDDSVGVGLTDLAAVRKKIAGRWKDHEPA